jgi:hypothetical protein
MTNLNQLKSLGGPSQLSSQLQELELGIDLGIGLRLRVLSYKSWS